MIKTWEYLVLLLALVSCRSDFDFEKNINAPTNLQEKFAKEFTKMYGAVSPEITWMTASEGIAQVDLSNLSRSEKYTIGFYTADPNAKPEICYLLAEYENVEGGEISELNYDYPTGLNSVYVVAHGSDECYYSSFVNTNREDSINTLSVDSLLVLQDIKPMCYRVCFEGYISREEDLDFDYNDVVAEMEYVRGRDSITILTVASGCECAVQLAYHRGANMQTGSDEVLFDEVHESLGFKGVIDRFTRKLIYFSINAGSNKTVRKGTKTIALNDDYNKSIVEIAPKLVAYFMLPAEKKGEKDQISSAYIPAQKGANHPQALLIADPTWMWPHDYRTISADMYGFRRWLADPASEPLWYGGEIWKEANQHFE